MQLYGSHKTHPHSTLLNKSTAPVGILMWLTFSVLEDTNFKSEDVGGIFLQLLVPT
jgi:hypothetical protein